MAEYIVGLNEYAKALKKADTRKATGSTCASIALKGVERVDAHTYRVTLKGSYPQFVYWLAMPFFAPVPWEADRFFAQPGMAAKNFTLDWWPVGTGAYMLTENNPNARMVLERNPNFRGEPYPSEGEPGDARGGPARRRGQDHAVHRQGGVHAREGGHPVLEQVPAGLLRHLRHRLATRSTRRCASRSRATPSVTPEMEEQGIRLRPRSTPPPLPRLQLARSGGRRQGSAERARKLRQAISIAVDWEEYISIFPTAAASRRTARSRPGIFGYREGEEGINPVTHEWSDGGPQRKPIEAAKKLLAEAGYPDGRDAKTGAAAGALLRHRRRAAPGDKARFDWWRRQFAKLSIQLVIRDTDWNRFQEKIRKGSHADLHPGLERRLSRTRRTSCSCCTGRRARAKTQGENAGNYANPEFDALFERMKNMPNSAERQQLIDRMVEIARARRALALGLPPQGLRPAPRLDRERQAEQHGAQQPQVPARSMPRSAAELRAAVEPAGAVAGRC